MEIKQDGSVKGKRKDGNSPRSVHRRLSASKTKQSAFKDIYRSPFWSAKFGEGTHRRETWTAMKNTPRLIKLLLYCLCSCFLGAYHLITERRTMQVALGFMLGRAFYFYVVEFTGELVLPPVEALFRAGEWNFVFFPSYITLTIPDNVTLTSGETSADEAIVAGCSVIRHIKIVKDFLQFWALICSIWVISNFQKAILKMRIQRERKANYEEKMANPSEAKESYDDAVFFELFLLLCEVKASRVKTYIITLSENHVQVEHIPLWDFTSLTRLEFLSGDIFRILLHRQDALKATADMINKSSKIKPRLRSESTEKNKAPNWIPTKIVSRFRTKTTNKGPHASNSNATVAVNEEKSTTKPLHADLDIELSNAKLKGPASKRWALLKENFIHKKKITKHVRTSLLLFENPDTNDAASHAEGTNNDPIDHHEDGKESEMSSSEISELKNLLSSKIAEEATEEAITKEAATACTKQGDDTANE